jgi:hypothetical protein
MLMKREIHLEMLVMLSTQGEPVLQYQAKQKYPSIQAQRSRFIKQVCGFFDIWASTAKLRML